MSDKTSAKRISGSILYVILALFATLALHCRWGSYGGAEEGFVLTFFRKLAITFQGLDFTDVIVFAGLACFFIKYLSGTRFDLQAFIVSLILSVTYLFSRQYSEFNSLNNLFGSKYSLIIFLMGVVGYTSVLYGLIVFLKTLLLRNKKAQNTEGKISRFFWPVSWGFLMLCYLPWLILNYPGSSMPDTVSQFQNYLGDVPWSMWQPPFSTLLMGWCYSLGKTLVDASFGFFLYALFHSVAATGIFSYSVNKLRKLGAPMKLCIPALLFYGLVPMWGAYAQWVEKDFLFAALGTLFTTYVIEVLATGEFGIRNFIKILIAGLLTVFLRNNGIYAVAPTLICFFFFVNKQARKWVAIAVLSVILVFEGVTRVLYPAIGVAGTSVSETIGFMFQQTARYVNTYPEEISPEEEAVLSRNFQGIEHFSEYDPQFIDPIKRYYNHSAPGEYFGLWIKQFFKHPFVYVEAYLNGACGYLAPVQADAGAFIMTDYPGYMTDVMGVEKKASGTGTDILIAVRNSSENQVLIRYFTYPGFYTWCIVLMLVLLAGKRKKGSWVAFVPVLMTLLVCTVSPIACAMRYALMAAAAAPVLALWTVHSCTSEESNTP